MPVFSDLKRGWIKLIELDFSEIMLQHNKDKWDCYTNMRLFHVQADALYLPFMVESLEWIICFAVLPHLSDQRKGLREWSQVLKPGGNLLILHLMGSQKLNCFHSGEGDTITQDLLQPVADLAAVVRQCGFDVIRAIDQDDLYLIHAIKNPTVR
jgi:demethylmenaquinone methyltransferase/2-methoxy-6-polyprenyl-1,4-benzoquinol methylase